MATPHGLPPPPTLVHGLRAALPLVPGVVAFGLVWGALAGQAGLGWAEAVLMSATVFAGAAQFVVLPLWSGGVVPALLPVLAATAAVNLRFVLMSASLLPLFEREPARRRWAHAVLVTDENWALASAEMQRGGGSVAHLLGSGLAVYAAWVGASAVGRLLGAVLGEPARWGLDFAFTASFLALLVGLWKGRASVLPWGVAAVAALLAQRWLPGHAYIVAGGLCGSLVGAWQRDPEAAAPPMEARP
jgi:4-azaleucine resistance transporter AzlC